MHSVILVLSLVLVPCLTIKCQQDCISGKIKINGEWKTISEASEHFGEDAPECSDDTIRECSDTGLYFLPKIILFLSFIYVL